MLHETNLQLCRELGLLRPRANSLVGLGTIYARQGDFARAIAPVLKKSLEVARQLDNPIALSNACYMLANTLVREEREMIRALALYEECLTIAPPASDGDRRVDGVSRPLVERIR